MIDTWQCTVTVPFLFTYCQLMSLVSNTLARARTILMRRRRSHSMAQSWATDPKLTPS